MAVASCLVKANYLKSSGEGDGEFPSIWSRNITLPFMPSPPATYFDKIDARLPKHGEEVARLQRGGILIDGEGVVDGGHTKVLLQIFSAKRDRLDLLRFIQRKGDDGFGEGNFKALFESIEEDQIRRGVLKVDTAA